MYIRRNGWVESQYLVHRQNCHYRRWYDITRHRVGTSIGRRRRLSNLTQLQRAALRVTTILALHYITNYKHWDSAHLRQGASYQCRDTDSNRIQIRIPIRMRDSDRHQNLTICSVAHWQPSLKISCKSVWKFLRKIANRQTNSDDYISSLAEVTVREIT